MKTDNWTIKIDSSSSSNGAYILEFKEPIYYFTYPYFEGLNKEPTTIPFCSREEFIEFLDRLPKDWIKEMFKRLINNHEH